MKLVIYDSKRKPLGIENINGSLWIVRGDQFICQNEIDVVLARTGRPDGFAFMDDKGKVLSFAIIQWSKPLPQMKKGCIVRFHVGNLTHTMHPAFSDA